MTKENLYTVLQDYSQSDILPMHMPGHKRNRKFQMCNPYEIDVTEVAGLDDLHHPEGIIRSLMERVKECYHSDQSYLLVNGSTGGILAAMTACVRHGDRILVARNCHKSVYNAIKLLELRPAYVYPSEEGGEMQTLGIAGVIQPTDVEEMLRQEMLAQKDKIACVVVTSPTYEGVVSPIKEIAEVTHRYGIPLIVDEAHGAHFQWHDLFPDTALQAGADLVIESLHKTLPAFTQTGILHLREGFVNRDRLEWALRTFQSSSPSYLLMASISQCFSYLENEGRKEFEIYTANLKEFRKKMQQLKHLRLFDTEQKEASKIVIATDRCSLSGRELAAWLRERFHIETEMSCGNYCIAMTSVADEKQTFERLAKALLAIDGEILAAKESFLQKESSLQKENFCQKQFFSRKKDKTPASFLWEKPETVMYGFEAAEYRTEAVSLNRAQGRIAAEMVCLYPPGIPAFVEGERISREMAEFLQEACERGHTVYGVNDGKIKVLTEEKQGMENGAETNPIQN